MNQISSLLKFLGGQLKNTSTPTIKTWSGEAVSLNTYKTVATFNIPAGTKVLILGITANGIGTANRNACNFQLESGTAAASILGNGLNNSGSGNAALGWAYIEATTACVLNVRQYGYDQAFTASGSAIAIPILGGVLRRAVNALQLLSLRNIGGVA